MEKLKHSWFKVPRTIRRPIVLVVGMVFVIAAGLTGWLPGPGGIPLFLIGVAILATEFEWAQRLRDFILRIIKQLGAWWRRHKIIGTITFAAVAAWFFGIAFTLYSLVR